VTVISKDERLARLAAKNEGVVTRAQLLLLGFSDKAISTALARRRWQQLQRGVYLLSPAEPTWRQRVRAASLAAGADGQVCGRTLAAWLGLDGATERVIEISVPYGKCPEPVGVVIHRTRHIGPKRTYDDAIPGTSVERLLVDYAALVPVDLAERAVESALSKGLTPERRIWREIAALGTAVPGVRRLERLMELRPKGKPARSTFEIELFKLIRQSGLPLPERNHDTWVDGDHFEIDLAYIDVRGAIEADSERYHGTATQRANDRRRQGELERAGWTFVRVRWADVFGRPEWVIEQIRTLLCRVVAA
jgi:very-short-patch-repair endonuclease